jgi:glucose-1-phosphate cytidylyltransferase
MKVVILAGGVGNRLGGDTRVGPKPMVEIGGHPLLWHIMTHYARYGFREFVVAVGHMGDQIKSYFADFRIAEHDVRFDFANGETSVLGESNGPDWVVDVVDTGQWTDSAGRVRRVGHLLGEGPFMATFGDAVSDVDIEALERFHRRAGKLATLTAVHPTPRFGELRLDVDRVDSFSEKPLDSSWINGGYLVMEPRVLDYIEGDDASLTPDLMQRLAKDEQLAAYRHDGFWQAVDSMRDKVLLEELWESGAAPWKVKK